MIGMRRILWKTVALAVYLPMICVALMAIMFAPWCVLPASRTAAIIYQRIRARGLRRPGRRPRPRPASGPALEPTEIYPPGAPLPYWLKYPPGSIDHEMGRVCDEFKRRGLV